MKKLSIIIFLLSFYMSFSDISTEYNFPIKNRYASTIIGTPHEARLPLYNLPKVEHRKLKHFNKRDIPDVFWFQPDYGYSLSAQTGPAPLAFVLPGMGGFYDGGHTTGMRDVLYNAGFHVIALSNPSHPSFLISASSTGTIGIIENDAKDLHKLMKAIYKKVSQELDITDRFLVSYSLGATYSSYVAKFDSEDKYFNFNKIFLINPSVNLIDSAVLFDSLMENTLPNGMSDVNEFIAEVEQILIEMPYELDPANIRKNADYLLKKNPPDEVFQKLIGLSFRNAISNVVFVSDVMTDMGQIVPEDQELNRFSSLTEYYEKSNSYGFFDYFRTFLLEYMEREHLNYGFEEIIKMASLENIKEFLSNAENVYVVTNKDELILTENDFRFLEDTFKERAKFYPIGGHCGNIFYKDNISYMLNILNEDMQ